MTDNADSYPDFVITCDHRGVGDSAMVARYVWSDAQGVWVPGGDAVTDPEDRQVLTYYGGAVRVTPLEGDRPGWWHPDRADDERIRTHHEITCRGRRCAVAPFRADADDLQILFAVIAANKAFRTDYVAKMSRQRLTVELGRLHGAQAEWNATVRHRP